MPAPSPATAQCRARVAGLSYRRDPNDPELVDARRELELSKLEDHVRRVLDAATPLSAEQRTKLAEILRPVRVRPGARKSGDLDGAA
jgi:hypothetical protein